MTAKFCPNCGASLEPQSKFCANCGQVIEQEEKPVKIPDLCSHVGDSLLFEYAAVT